MKCPKFGSSHYVKNGFASGKARKISGGMKVAEIDELHSYIGSKKACWVWMVVDPLGERYLDGVIGKRNSRTSQRL